MVSAAPAAHKDRLLHSDDGMRYTSWKAVFTHPFRLGAAYEIYPAGVYGVETAEAAYDVLRRSAYVRTSTVLVIPTAAGTCDRVIDPDELDEALKLDAERTAQTG